MSYKLKGVLNDTKMPKQRDFLPGKRFRDTVRKWGEPTHLHRKRVIIVPSIDCEAKEVDLDKLERGKAVKNKSGDDSGSVILSGDEFKSEKLRSDYEKYKTWIAERKKMRSIINHSGLNQTWLDKKYGKTPLEKRVLKRMKRDHTPDIRIRKVIPDIKPLEEDPSTTGVDKGVPAIHQPSPAALATIQEYLDKKRMRLVDLFAQADKDKNWIVSRAEFRNIIKTSGIALSDTDLEDLIMALDKDENDALDYMELSTGRQAYLDERLERNSIQAPTNVDLRQPNLKLAGTGEESKDGIIDTKEGSEIRPTSPKRTPPGSPTLQELPDSGSSSASYSRRPSSPSLLDIPATILSEKVEKISLDEMKVKRMKKQQRRKEREISKQKKKQPERPQVAPSTLGGITGEVVDKYRKRTMQEYNDTVNLCDMHGVQLSKALLGRVLLQPEDKPIAQCKPKLRTPSRFAITSRHHLPSITQLNNPNWTI